MLNNLFIKTTSEEEIHLFITTNKKQQFGVEKV